MTNVNVDSMVRIERINYLLGAVITLVSLFVGTRAQVLGIAVGVALTCLNFTALRRIVYRWTADTAAGKSSSRVALVMPKMMALMGAVVVALMFLPISAIAFTIGYSVFLVSIAIETLYSSLKPHTGTDNG
jgi:hypothetical protein